MLSYVTSFLKSEALAVRAQSFGERLGEGKAPFFPAFAASPPDLGRPLQVLLFKHPRSKEAPPTRHWEPGKAVARV